jgi:hypothetical protein
MQSRGRPHWLAPTVLLGNLGGRLLDQFGFADLFTERWPRPAQVPSDRAHGLQKADRTRNDVGFGWALDGSGETVGCGGVMARRLR